MTSAERQEMARLFAAYAEHLDMAVRGAKGEGVLPLGFFVGVQSLKAAVEKALAVPAAPTERYESHESCGGCLVGSPLGTGMHNFGAGCRFNKSKATR